MSQEKIEFETDPPLQRKSRKASVTMHEKIIQAADELSNEQKEMDMEIKNKNDFKKRIREGILDQRDEDKYHKAMRAATQTKEHVQPHWGDGHGNKNGDVK